jgi:DNA modification methylase
MSELAIEYESVEALIPYAANSRTHSDAQVAQIAASIKEFGWTNPILIDGDNPIIAGHGRLLAARKLGMEKVPAIRIGHLSKAQQRALVIADNQLAMNAGWDMDMLKAEIEGLKLDDFDVDLLGFDDKFLDGLLEPDLTEGLTDEDAVPEVPEHPKTVLGDVWVLGNHRLMCGDSTSIDDYDKLTDGGKPILMLSDPPYGIGYEYVGHDDSSSEGNDRLCADVFALAPDSKVYTPGLMNLRRELNRYPKAKVAVWHKKFAAAGNGLGGASTWEPIIIESPMSASLRNDVLQIMTERHEVGGKSLRELHSCPKPVALYRELLQSFSRSGDSVYEPFCGSGTTLIACEAENRNCFAMEITPAYCDVIVTRWQEFTGKQAIHAETGEPFDASR